jgi:hypothetical protein
LYGFHSASAQGRVSEGKYQEAFDCITKVMTELIFSVFRACFGWGVGRGGGWLGDSSKREAKTHFICTKRIVITNIYTDIHNLSSTHISVKRLLIFRSSLSAVKAVTCPLPTITLLEKFYNEPT